MSKKLTINKLAKGVKVIMAERAKNNAVEQARQSFWKTAQTRQLGNY